MLPGFARYTPLVTATALEGGTCLAQHELLEKFTAKVSELVQAFGAAGQASKIKKVFNLEDMQKRYDKGELDPKVN